MFMYKLFRIGQGKLTIQQDAILTKGHFDSVSVNIKMCRY